MKALFEERCLFPSRLYPFSMYSVLLNFRQKLADRSEASLKVSEFSVSSEGKLTKETVCMDLVEFQKHNGLLPLGALFPAIFDVVSESYHTYLPMSE